MLRPYSFITALFVVVSLVQADSATAQTVIPMTAAGTMVKNNPAALCMNTIFWKTPMPCPIGFGACGPIGNLDAAAAMKDFQSETGSFLAHLTLNYHHYVYDYLPGEPAAGCTSCAGGSSLGGSELMKLFVQRHHRYRDLSQRASFGPGVFCNYDVSLQFEPNTVTTHNDPNNPYNVTYSTAYRVEMFDPSEEVPKFLSDGIDGDTKDGIYSDTFSKWVKDFRCFDASGTLVVDPATAATAVLTNWPGQKYEFEIFNLDILPTDALGWWKFDEGSGNTTADSTGDGNTGTLFNSPTWVAGQSGDALQFNGAGNYVSAGNPADLNIQGQITIAAWVNLSTNQGTNQGPPKSFVATHGAGGNSFPPQPQVYLSVGNGLAAAGAKNSSGGSSMVSTGISSSTDYGLWVHWAASFDGTNWNLYRNGTLVSSQAGTVGALSVSDNWYLGGSPNGPMGPCGVNGAVDDVRVFSRALAHDEVAALANLPTLVGRLKSITDRNGYAVTLNYKTFTAQQLAQSPDLQWQIDTVTDPYGRQAGFSYLPTQVSGQWVVNQINFPNTHKAVYGYANGQLATVAFDDGTQSRFTYGSDANSGCTTLGVFDVAADGVHRNKTVYLSNNAAMNGNDPAIDDQIVTQSSLLGRMVVNANNEVTFLGMFTAIDTAAYEGAGRFRKTNSHYNSQYFQDWTVGDPAQGVNAITGTVEATSVAVETSPDGSLTIYADAQGHSYTYANDADMFATSKSYGDLTSENWSYNGFKQVTRYQDRNLNVTLYTYDPQGNLLSKEVGIKNVSGVDTHQPEYAKYQWTYYPAGNANQYLVSAAIDANGNSTQYLYSNNHLLTQVIEPPDAQGDQQATTTFTYDAALRIQQVTDPVNRAVVYAYDQRDRVSTVTYGDSSTEQFFYGVPGSGNENLLVKQKDRNGVTTRFDFDASGRLTTTTFAYSTIVNGTENLITDPSVQVTKTCTYLAGTDLVASCTERGETTTYDYDYRQRMVSSTVQPRSGVLLTTTRTYLDNLLFSEQDPYGRLKYYGYRSSDGAPIREIQGTVPGFTLADFTAVANQTRDQSPNAKFLITDYTLDNAGQRTAIIDGRANTLAQTFDSRGQLVQAVEASGTPVAATTGYLYDAQGNQIEHRTPRYYDTSDPQVGNCRTTMTYTGRSLLATRTEAPGTSVAATVQYAYNLDRTQSIMTDARNNPWETLWSACCAGRRVGDLDPLAAGTSVEYDYAGNITYLQAVQGATTFNQVTARYDARRRPIFRTVWLVNPGAVDPNNPPIAGQNGIPAANGLTTQWYYDENLADNVGLSNPAGEAITGIGNVTIQPLLAELQADGVAFGAGSDGYAVLEVDPDGQLLVTSFDGASRKVSTAVIQPPSGQNPNQPVTWTTRIDDTVATVSAPGNLLETAYIDALNNIVRQRTDGARRLIQRVDAESNITVITYDAKSNQLSISDPNSVGYTAVFDARNRETSRTDTTNAQTQTVFDANSNRVKSLDAKNNNSTLLFDARDRRVSLTDRIGGITAWSLDQNSNVLSITDSESRTTSYTYSSTNKPLTEMYADNSPPAVNDQQELAYDGIGRVESLTRQDGSYITFVWDMANRINARQYRTSAQQPPDPPTDTDTFTFDGGSRIVSASSGRYGNSLTFDYDQAGRLISEALTISGQTYTVDRGYDTASRVVSITYPDGSAVAQTFTPRRLLEKVNYEGALAASFVYDAGGRHSTRTLGDGPGTTTTWSYLPGANLVASLATPNLPSFSYAWDANRNKTAEAATSVLQPYGFSTGAAGYDLADRLVAWNRADGNKNDSWTLTTVGDWQQFIENGTTHNRSHNSVHELLADGGAQFTYDTRGNLLSNGATGAVFTWDADDHLQQTTIAGATVNCTYDALGRRVTKTSGGQTTVYVCANQMGYIPRTGLEIAEYTAGAAPATPNRTFIFDPSADQPICTAAEGTVYYYHQNGTRSTAAVTDSTGSLAECYAYNAVGATTIFAADGVTVRPASAVGNPFMYTSRRFDADTGLYYFRARYYDYGQGRFISRDPVDYDYADYNLYRYARNAPLTHYDPLGTFAEPDPAVQPQNANGCMATWGGTWDYFSDPGWDGAFVDPNDPNCTWIPMGEFTNYLQKQGCILSAKTIEFLDYGCVGMCACIWNCGSGFKLKKEDDNPDVHIAGPHCFLDTDTKAQDGKRKAMELAKHNETGGRLKCIVFAKQGAYNKMKTWPPQKPVVEPGDIALPPDNDFNYVTIQGDYCVSMDNAAIVGPQHVKICKAPSCEPKDRYQVTAWCVACRSCRNRPRELPGK